MQTYAKFDAAGFATLRIEDPTAPITVGEERYIPVRSGNTRRCFVLAILRTGKDRCDLPWYDIRVRTADGK